METLGAEADHHLSRRVPLRRIRGDAAEGVPVEPGAAGDVPADEPDRRDARIHHGQRAPRRLRKTA